MKTKACTFLAGLCLISAAQAGATTTSSAQAPAGDLWRWFAGGSVGYLTDNNEPMYSLQVGMELHDSRWSGTHAVYLEVGYTADDAAFNSAPGLPGSVYEEARIDLDLIPITLNYSYEAAIAERWNWYAGFGLGVAIVETSYDWSWSQAVPPPNHGGGSDDDTAVRLYGGLRVGVTFDVNDSFRFLAGARYIMMDEDDRHIDVTGVSDYGAGINNEFMLEAGLLWRF